MISRKGGREPHIIVHLDVKRRAKGMRERRMGVIEVTEIGGVDRSAG